MNTPHLQVGVGRRDITPPLGTLLMGYPDPHGSRGATAVRDPLNATAIAIESADGQKQAAIVSLDIALAADPIVDAIRQQASEATGIPGDHVTVCAIQTHSGPCIQHVPGWCEPDASFIDDLLVPGAVAAITEAWASRAPARIGVSTVNSNAGINRREILDNHGIGLGQLPWGVIDPTMTVLRIDTAAGVLANVVHYGAHPTVLGGWSRVISRDWPGVMIDRVEALTGATTMFINGAVGDVAPRTNSLGAVGDERNAGEPALMETGMVAAMDAMRAWRSIRDMRNLDLNIHTETLQLPYRPLPSRDEAEREFAAIEPRKNEAGAGMCEYSHWKAVLDEYDANRQLTHRPYHQTITAIGPIALAPFPGEPFAETIVRLRHASPFQHTLAASTSCGSLGYFVTRESLHRGGYEVWVAKAYGAYILAEHIDDVLLDENHRLLDRVFDEMNPPIAAASTPA